jgi:hypothetical protein
VIFNLPAGDLHIQAYEGCHSRLPRHDGTPSLTAFSPHVATRRPLLRLLPDPTRSPVLTSSRPTFLDLHPLTSGSIRRVPGPYRTAPGSQPTSTQHTHTRHTHHRLPSLKALPLSPSLSIYQASLLFGVLALEKTALDFAPLPIHCFHQPQPSSSTSHHEPTRRRRRPTYPNGLDR